MAHRFNAAALAGLLVKNRRREPDDPRPSVAELARRLNVGESTVRSWRTGRRLPSADALFALAEALGVEPGALMAPPEPAPRRKKRKPRR